MDDVIRIRVDLTRAVRAFQDLLAAQAAEGETRAPANPANRAIFRELAPYRLVEYSYVDPEIGDIDGAYLGFPDGRIYSVGDDIPEEVVDAMIAAGTAPMAPVYVYVVLARPASLAAIRHFISALSLHLAQPLAAFGRDEGGAVTLVSGETRRGIAGLAETDRHLSRQEIIDRVEASINGDDGRVYARITYQYGIHLLEFSQASDRDDFIAWSQALCRWVEGNGGQWHAVAADEVLRPAQPSPAPLGGQVATPVRSPSAFIGGSAWAGFGDGSGPVDPEALKPYWRYITAAVAQAEAKVRLRR
jgi:hypothetical protein